MSLGRPKDKRDVSPRLRWALDEAMNLLETRSGKDVAQHIADDMEKFGIGTIVKQFAHIFPRQVDMTLDQQVTIDTTKLTREVVEALYLSEEPSDHNEGTSPAVH